MPNPEIKCDLLVIGSGLAGMAASLFAVGRDVDTLQVGQTSELVFSTGMLDLLGVHPVESGRVWDDPWAGIEQLIRDRPLHPYGRLGLQSIRDAMEEFVDFMAGAGHTYVMHPDRNARVITPLGTIKTTYAVPQTMIKGIEALEAWFAKIGSPTTLAAGNIPASDIPKIAENAVQAAILWDLKGYTQEVIAEILHLCI